MKLNQYPTQPQEVVKGLFLFFVFFSFLNIVYHRPVTAVERGLTDGEGNRLNTSLILAQLRRQPGIRKQHVLWSPSSNSISAFSL